MHLFTAAALLLLAWGAFAFGAVYTWAHAPLLIFAVAVAALGFLAGRNTAGGGLRPYRALAIGLAALLAFSILQVTPLPQSAITSIAPARDDADYPKLYAAHTGREHDPKAPQEPPRTLSVQPSRTALGIAFLSVFALLFLGAANGFSGIRPTAFARGVIAIGVLAAFVELAQIGLGATGLVYGSFPPLNSFIPSAPFLNANHTAGFLVMTCAVALGYFASTVSIGWRGVRPGWRARALWFGSRAGAESTFAALAVIAMATAIIASASRSGALTLALALTMFAYLVVRRGTSRGGKAILLSTALVAIVAAATLGGISSVMGRFGNISAHDPADRAGIWKSAARQARDFPVTGTGLNTFGVASLHYQDRSGNGYQHETANVEAHSDYLQLLSEGGLLLGLPALASVIAFVTLIRRRFAEGRDDVRIYWLRAGAVMAIAAAACQALVEFTLQMPGAAAMFVMLAALAIHRPSVVSRSSAAEPVE